jgi:hypothetical protein
MQSVTTHVVYWDPNHEFTATTKAIVDGFFGNVAHDSGLPSNVFAIAGQYTDATGHAAYSSTSTTSIVDSQEFPASACVPPVGGDPGPPYTKCLEDEQLQSELTRFIGVQKLPVGPTQMYFLLLPHRVATCLEEEFEVEPSEFEQVCSNNFFCAYHSYIEPGTASEIIYADIPFSLLDSLDAKGCQDDGRAEIQQPSPDNAGGNDTETRFADVALKYISHEYIEAATDPLVGEETAWVDAQGQEIGDKCNGVTGRANGIGRDPNAFLPEIGTTEGSRFNQSINSGSYYLQSEWDNGGKACLMQPVSLGAGSFSAPSGTAGSPVSFTGTATDAYGGFEPTWSFGDGTTAAGPSVAHTYAAAGQYTVTMTPRDGLTNSTGAPVSHPVTIAPPPAPPPPAATVATAPTAVTAVKANSGFASATAAVNAKTGSIALTTSVLDPGKLSFHGTFANGRFGAFTSSACKSSQIKLARRCLPATILYAKGARTVTGASTLTVMLKPTASALKALKRALRRKRAITVTIVLTFQSSRGGAPVTHARSVTVKPRR